MAYWDVGPDGDFGTSGCYAEYDRATRGPCLTMDRAWGWDRAQHQALPQPRVGARCLAWAWHVGHQPRHPHGERKAWWFWLGVSTGGGCVCEDCV